MKEKSRASYLMLMASMLIFGTIGIFRRYIPLPSALLACTRGFLGSLVLFVFIKLKKRPLCHGIGWKKVFLLALTGALMGANWIFLFEAYNYTTVAVATLCYYMQPTIVILLSPLLFREKLGKKKLLCAVLSIVGMVLVSGLADGNVGKGANSKGILLGLTAAALYSSVVIMNKKVQIEDVYEKTIIQLLGAAIVLVPYLLFTGEYQGITLTGFSLGMLLIVGIIHTGLAYALYFGSIGYLPAQSSAILSYLDPVFALILSAFLLHESLTFLGLSGAILIIGAALLSEVESKRKPCEKGQ